MITWVIVAFVLLSAYWLYPALTIKVAKTLVSGALSVLADAFALLLAWI